MKRFQRKQSLRQRREARTRGRIRGTSIQPRLCAFRSLNHVYAQIIDDQKRRTIVSSSDLVLGSDAFTASYVQKLSTKQTHAYAVGYDVAQKAIVQGVTRVVFDRGAYKYHGRVKALAEGARAAGLEF